MNEEKTVINVDSVVKFFGLMSAVIASVFAAYLHFVSLVSELENRIDDLEKQKIKDEKYQDYANKNRIDIENIQNDMRSMNETVTELIRTLRYKGIEQEP